MNLPLQVRGERATHQARAQTASETRAESSTRTEPSDRPYVFRSRDEEVHTVEHKLEQTPEERAAVEQPLLDKAEASLSGIVLSHFLYSSYSSFASATRLHPPFACGLKN